MYFCAIPSSSPVQNELSLTTPNFSLFVLELPFQIEKRKLYFTVRFGTSVSKSKCESYISLFVLELSLPIEKRKLICHNLFWKKSKNRALSVLELALQIEERTLKQKLDSQFDTEERPTSLLHKSLSNSNRNREKNSAFKLDTACHEGLRFATLKLDRFLPGWRSQGQWEWCGRGIEVSTPQVRKPAHSGWSITL